MSTAGTLYDETVKNGYAKLLNVQTATTGTASLNFVSGFSSAYDVYVFDIDNIYLASDGVHFVFQVSIDGGVSWLTSYWYCSTALFSNQGPPPVLNAYGSNINLGGVYETWVMLSFGEVVTHPIGGYVRLYSHPQNVSTILWKTTGHHASLYTAANIGSGFYPSTGTINGIRFFPHGSTINAGIIRMYGMIK